jgi:RHS repeat-associated protein
MRHPTVGPLFFGGLPLAAGEESGAIEMVDGARLSDHGDEYGVRTKEDWIYHFPKALARANARGGMEYPIARIADRCGNWLEFERRGGVIAAINESAGRRLNFDVRDGRIREIELVVPGTTVHHTFVRYEYDSAGDLAAVFDALGHAYRFAYDEHHMVRHTDRNGLSFYYEYDKEGEDWRVVHAWGDGGLYDYGFEYVDALKERRITDALGQVSLVTLDDRGLPICEVDPLGGRTTYEYDEAGRTTAVVDPAGRRTEYAYDERGNLLKLTRPDGTTATTAYQDDKVVAFTTPNGARWEQRWDSRGLLIEQRSPLGAASRYTYDHLGQLATFVNARGAETVFRFDAAGNLAWLDDALGRRTTFDFDALGNVIARVDAEGRRMRCRYDAKSRPISVDLSSGAHIACAYDAEDNLIEYVDESGGTTRFEYVGQGEVARRIEPDGQIVEYLYDAHERLIAVRNQRGELYELKRDALGRVVEEVDYWGQSRRYAFDPGGHLVTSWDALQRRIDYRTDPLGRIVAKAMADPRVEGALFTETFAFDADGNLIETANPHVTVRCQFDADGRLVKEEQAQTTGERFVVENTYDALGNRITRTTSLGNTVEYGYDLADNVVEIGINGGEPRRIRRDGLDRIVEEQLPRGVARRCAYDDNDDLVEQSMAKDGALLFATQYAYDGAGNLTARRDTHYGTDTYLHDPVGRILAHTDPQGQIRRYVHDPAGDRLVTRAAGPAAYAAAGAPAAVMTATDWWREGSCERARYRFDPAGNLVLKVDAQVKLELEWDSNQRLSASRKNGVLTVYGYDPLGRRLFKDTNGQRVWFGWDLEALAADVTSDRPREFVNYPDGFAPMAMLVGAAGPARQVLNYYNDPNGRPARLVDAEGTLQWAGSFDVWGRLRHVDVCLIDNPLRLQGQYEDSETGLRYARHRYFDAQSGQWTSSDPIRLLAGENLYAYAPNADAWTDPLGLRCGRQGERIARRFLEGQGFKIVGSLQNRSGHGVDLIARDRNGLLHFFEVKTSSGIRAPGLSVDQAKGAASFAMSRLRRAAAGLGAWGAVHDPHSAARARALLTEIASSGGTVRGEVIQVTLGDGRIVRKPW